MYFRKDTKVYCCKPSIVKAGEMKLMNQLRLPFKKCALCTGRRNNVMQWPRVKPEAASRGHSISQLSWGGGWGSPPMKRRSILKETASRNLFNHLGKYLREPDSYVYLTGPDLRKLLFRDSQHSALESDFLLLQQPNTPHLSPLN